MSQEKVQGLENKLGYTFKDQTLLIQALTHKSFANEYRSESSGHNERFEFLGDTILDFLVSDILMKLCPESQEGELSKLRAVIVSEPNLSEAARALGIGPHLLLGKGEELTHGREKSSLLANSVEAIIAAIYLDGGLEESYHFIRDNFESQIKALVANGLTHDYKTDLQEQCQSLFGALPKYTVVGESGPDHQKLFEVEIVAGGGALGKGVGRSKKEAEQMAAKEALERLKRP